MPLKDAKAPSLTPGFPHIKCIGGAWFFHAFLDLIDDPQGLGFWDRNGLGLRAAA